MRNHRLLRRRHALLHLLTTLLVIAVLAMLQGCGGGGSGSGGSSFGGGDGSGLASTPGTGSTPTTTINPGTNPGTTTAGTGTFKITLLLPGEDKADKVIPYHYKKLKTSFTCEVGTVDDDVLDITPGSTKVERTISNIPVGLNIATIQILTDSDEVLAQRKHGFYMTSGETASAGSAGNPLSLGVAVVNNLCAPAKIDVQKDTILFYENRDAVDREVKAGAKTTGTIAAVNNGSQPVSSATYDAKSITFDAAGTYQYVNLFGGDGSADYRVIVYEDPTVVSIKDGGGTGDNYSTSDDQEPVTFVITGTGFGDSQAMVDGTVTFIDVNPPGGTNDYAAAVTDWADTQITGTIVLPKSSGAGHTGLLDAGGGKYRLQISVRGTNTIENVYYYKGTGTYTVTVD